MSRIGGAPVAVAPSLMGPWLMLFLASSSGPVATPPQALQETEVLRIAVSAGAAAISNRECSGSERFCAAGLGFLGPDDTLYFYDFGNDNLKVIALRPGRLVRVIPGLGSVRGAGELPLAGAVSDEGMLQLLVTAPGSQTRPTLWTLERGGSSWRRASAADALAASATLMTAPVAGSERAPGGVTLGHDQAGNAFVEIPKSWSVHQLAKVAPDGRLLAQATLPERPIWKPLAGWTDKWVTSGGDVIEIHVGPRWLVVSRWTPGA